MTQKNSPPVLAFEDRFPISEKKLIKSLSDDEIKDINNSAADVLHSIISLEQLSFEHADPDAKGTSAEIHRIEQKLDFVTELLAKVLQSQQKIPDNKSIRMSAEYVEWCPDILVGVGDLCLISIYLSQKYPLPLELPIEVMSRIDDRRIRGTILLSDENVIDDLTRMVFLFHRRQIARDRAQS